MLARALFTFPARRAQRMAMPDLVERKWTAEDVRALPEDGNRYECIDGALLVTPAPSYDHGYAVEFLYDRLRDYVRANALGALRLAPADVEIVPGTMVQPDLFVARSADGARIRDWREIAELVLAVEVLSPTAAQPGFYAGIPRRPAPPLAGHSSRRLPNPAETSARRPRRVTRARAGLHFRHTWAGTAVASLPLSRGELVHCRSFAGCLPAGHPRTFLHDRPENPRNGRDRRYRGR